MSEVRLRAQIGDAYPGADILFTGPVLWSGWDLDDTFAVIEYNGERKVITTDHGRVNEVDTTWLYQRRREAGAAIHTYLEGVRWAAGMRKPEDT